MKKYIKPCLELTISETQDVILVSDGSVSKSEEIFDFEITERV